MLRSTRVSHFFPFTRRSDAVRLVSQSTSRDSASEDEIKEARAWLTRFNAETIPKELYEFSFSRSSGPGGQNVNKVNSKATLKVPFSPLQSLLPKLLWPTIKASRYTSERSDELVIQSDESRKQQENMQKCLLKLRDLIMQAAHENVPGETSQAQKARVKNFQAASNENRLKTKKFHSDKKSSRRPSKPDY